MLHRLPCTHVGQAPGRRVRARRRRRCAHGRCPHCPACPAPPASALLSRRPPQSADLAARAPGGKRVPLPECGCRPGTGDLVPRLQNRQDDLQPPQTLATQRRSHDRRWRPTPGARLRRAPPTVLGPLLSAARERACAPPRPAPPAAPAPLAESLGNAQAPRTRSARLPRNTQAPGLPRGDGFTSRVPPAYPRYAEVLGHVGS